jgi:hypothetical protein
MTTMTGIFLFLVCGELFLILAALLALNPKADPMYTSSGHCTFPMMGGTIECGY